MNSYTQRLRNRVCGICIRGNEILLVKLRIGAPGNFLWLPPGGGIEFGETAAAALEREFLEETGLVVQTGRLLFVNEFIRPPLHAIELFFEVSLLSGNLQRGTDPELGNQQIIEEVRWMSFEQLRLEDPRSLHAMFQYCHSIEDVSRLQGYWSHS